MTSVEIPLISKEKKRLEVRIPIEDHEYARRQGIDIIQVCKNAIKQVVKQSKREGHSCNTVFPRVTEAAKAATQPPIRTTYKRQKK